MENAISDSLKAFKKIYFRQGKFIEDYSAFDGDVLDYKSVLDGNGRSIIVGNSIFSPRIKRISHFPISFFIKKYKNIESSYVLTIHNKLPQGINGRVKYKELREIELDIKEKTQAELISMINDFLHMTNAELMERFGIERSWFANETLNYMDKQDKKVLERRKFEDKVIRSINEGKRLSEEIEKQKEDANSGNTIIHER